MNSRASFRDLQTFYNLKTVAEDRYIAITLNFFPLLDVLTWMAAGYGERAVEPRLRPSRGLSGVLSEVCVARQYASKYSARCSHASSSWFSSRIISNISWGGKGKRGECSCCCCCIWISFQSSPLEWSSYCLNSLKSDSQKDTVLVFLPQQAAHSGVCFEIFLSIWSASGGPGGSTHTGGKHKERSPIKHQLWVSSHFTLKCK